MTIIQPFLPIYVVDSLGNPALNNIFRIAIRRGVACAGAVLGQERYERGRKLWVWAAIFAGIALGVWLGGFAGALSGGILGYCTVFVTTITSVARKTEYQSRAIEIEIAWRYYMRDRDAYRRGEATTLQTNPHSRGRMVNDIEHDLALLQGWAIDYVDKHRARIERDNAALARVFRHPDDPAVLVSRRVAIG